MTLGTTGLDDSSPVLVDITTGAGTLSTDVQTLDADVNLLTTAVGVNTTAVNALAAVTFGPSTAVYSGTVTAPVNGGTAIIIGTQACKSVMLQAAAGNTQTVLFGSAVGTCTMELPAGTYSQPLLVTNVNLIFVKSAGAATQTVNWIARN